MNCAEFESILADYLDGSLSTAEVAAFEEHAAACSGCREFMSEVSGGLGVLKRAQGIEPPAELITRIAYLAPAGRSREPFERQSSVSRMASKWLLPMLQPRLAMGMAMTILSFAMLERCTGLQVRRVQAADLNPVRVWGGVEDRAMRVKDEVVKYYDNLRIVYEIETHLKDLEEPQRMNARQTTQTVKPNTRDSQIDGGGASHSPQDEGGASHTSQTKNGAGISQPPGGNRP